MKTITNYSYKIWHKTIFMAFLVFLICFIAFQKNNEIYEAILLAAVLPTFMLLNLLISRRTISVSISDTIMQFIENSVFLGTKSISFCIEDIDIVIEKIVVYKSRQKITVLCVRDSKTQKDLYRLKLDDSGWDEENIRLFLKTNGIISKFL